MVTIVLEYGLWDQLRVDHGMEWILTLFVQETLAHLRRNTNRAPHLQTTSKQVNNNEDLMQNHCVERMWVEINARVNYPLKACLIEMQERNEINMDCDHERFCFLVCSSCIQCRHLSCCTSLECSSNTR